MQLTPGTIYLADQRGVTEGEQFSRWSTFNYAGYFDAERQPFGALLKLNDEIFLPGCQFKYQSVQNSWVVIVPITGEIACIDFDGKQTIIDVGQVQVYYVKGGNSINIANNYREDRINFLYLEFAADEIGQGSAQLFGFDFEGQENQLIPVVELPAFALHIGMFAGREETLYQMRDKNALFFAFVIAGAFELQGRLMHQRDGLALWDLHEADMEALSNNAVILLMEIKR
jgi:redox-sensitive bicupin YhaK (pirin superfamily)